MQLISSCISLSSIWEFCFLLVWSRDACCVSFLVSPLSHARSRAGTRKILSSEMRWSRVENVVDFCHEWRINLRSCIQAERETNTRRLLPSPKALLVVLVHITTQRTTAQTYCVLLGQRTVLNQRDTWQSIDSHNNWISKQFVLLVLGTMYTRIHIHTVCESYRLDDNIIVYRKNTILLPVPLAPAGLIRLS